MGFEAIDRTRNAVAKSADNLRRAVTPRPVDYSERTAYRPPPALYQRFQWLARPIFRLGLNPDSTTLLEVKGRASGKTRRVALVMVSHDDQHYVVALAGESEWVRNVRAADGEAVLRRRTTLPVKLIELPVEERPPVIAAYLHRDGREGSPAAGREARYYFGLEPDPSLDNIADIAGHYPVFRVVRRADDPARERLERDEAETIRLDGERGEMPVYLAAPNGEGPWPGVVIIHDGLGMTTDLKNQVDWLASEGYLAAAPDLYYWGGRVRCMFSVMRQAVAREGQVFNDLEMVRAWLAQRDDCSGKVGVIGFCMGGGFAVLLASDCGYSASSVNYGGVPEDALSLMANACPIVASYGGKDRTLTEEPDRLEDVLSVHEIDHDVKVYPDAGHGFMNDHPSSEVPLWAMISGKLASTDYHEPSTNDARERIIRFFDHHLKS
ncbi:MAG: nitroreductase/quinone reductase family protein [Thermomicrobiales bacterium]